MGAQSASTVVSDLHARSVARQRLERTRRLARGSSVTVQPVPKLPPFPPPLGGRSSCTRISRLSKPLTLLEQPGRSDRAKRLRGHVPRLEPPLGGDAFEQRQRLRLPKRRDENRARATNRVLVPRPGCRLSVPGDGPRGCRLSVPVPSPRRRSHAFSSGVTLSGSYNTSDATTRSTLGRIEPPAKQSRRPNLPSSAARYAPNRRGRRRRSTRRWIGIVRLERRLRRDFSRGSRARRRRRR